MKKTVPGAVIIGGDYQGLGIARSLGRRRIPVCVVDDEISIARASRYVGCSIRAGDLREEDALLNALKSARTAIGQPGWVLFPTRDENVAHLAAHRERLSQEFRVPTPELTCVRQAWDKRETYRLARELDIPIPASWFPRSESDLGPIDVTAPVVIKPAIKEHFFYATRAKAWRADTRAELENCFRRAAAITADDEIIVQEMIPGDGAEQFSYCVFFKDDEAVASMTVRRLRQHPSDFGRASTYVRTVTEPVIADYSLRFLRAIGYYGLAELEYKRDHRDGAFKLLDVNARTWGYHSLGRTAGVDFPYLLYRDQLGEPVPPAHARPDVGWIRLATDLPNAVRDLRAGELRLAAYLRSLRKADTEAVFSVTDPLPFGYEMALLPYLAIKRGL